MNRYNLLFLIFLFWDAAALAQELPAEEDAPEIRRYTVEVIVFRYAEEVSTGTEIFLPEEIEIPEGYILGPDGELVEDPLYIDEDMLAEAEDADALPVEAPEAADEELEIDPNAPVFELVVLGEEDYVLTDVVEKLGELDAYEPMLHAAWTQTAFPEEETPAIDIREFGEPPEGLDGTFTLYLSRFLHLVVDLSLLAPEEQQASDEFVAFDDAGDDNVIVYTDDAQYADFDVGVLYPQTLFRPLAFEIHENRIVRNQETRYFDHPKFGVIAKIVRYEEPEEDEAFPDDTEFLLPAGD